MLIPTGTRHYSSLTGSMWRPVRCQFCGSESSYKLTRRGAGLASAPLFLDMPGAKKRAASKAESDLMRTLLNPRVVDAVPCPDCGKYQPRMIAKIRRGSWKPVTYAGLLMMVVALFTFFIALTYSHNPFTDRTFLIFVGLGVLFFFIQIAHAMTIDPNRDEAGGRRSAPSADVIRRSDYAKADREKIYVDGW